LPFEIQTAFLTSLFVKPGRPFWTAAKGPRSF